MIWVIFMIACFIVQIAGGAELAAVNGVSNENMWACLYYMFMHTGWLHLIVNAVSLAVMVSPITFLYRRRFDPMERYNSWMKSGTVLFIASYIGAVLAGAICAGDIPTVGASGMVFFLLGVLLILNPTPRQLKGYVWVMLAVLVQWYFGKTNVALHIVAFILGSLFIVTREMIRRIKCKV